MTTTTPRCLVVRAQDGYRAVCDACSYRGSPKEAVGDARAALDQHCRTGKHLRITGRWGSPAANCS